MRIQLVALLLFPRFLVSQDSLHHRADAFVRALLVGGDSIKVCIDDSALSTSNRLGITYEGVFLKCLISYDFDDAVKARLRKGELQYTASVVPCERGYDRLTLTIPGAGLSRDFYLRDGCMTSPLSYLSAGWKVITTRFFSFIVSDPSLISSYATKQLEAFVLSSGSFLGYSPADYEVLERQKILYYLCRDEDEIQRLTGFRTRGMYNLAYDAIVSTFNAHYHELTHLLINFKLRHGKLFTHPFLQEGLAVALGGRGGLDAHVVMQLGSYLDDSGMLRYPGLLRRAEFTSFDPSLSYPVCGLYNRFLLEALGGEGYLTLYKRHCGAPGDSSVESIAEIELPSRELWDSFLKRFRDGKSIQLRRPGAEDRLVWRTDSTELYEGRNDLLFLLRHSLLFGPSDLSTPYRSNKFVELFPATAYNGRRYACVADSQSISVYDLFTNTLIASYVSSFTLSPAPVPIERGMFCFSVPKAFFPDAMDTLLANPDGRRRSSDSR